MVQIANHSHCVICSRAVTFGDKTCSPECAAKLTEIDRKRKRSMTMMYVLMGLAVLVLVLSLSGIGV